VLLNPPHNQMNLLQLKNSINLFCISIILTAFVLSGCSEKNQVESFYAMGGIPVNIIASDVSAEWLTQATSEARKNVEKWESELSLYRPDSAINQIQFAVEKPVILSEKGWDALVFAKRAESITDGAFDVTVGSIIKVWKEAEKNNHLPDPAKLLRAVQVTGFDNLVFEADKRGIRINPKSENGDLSESNKVRLDVGGFAKGMFAQWISESLMNQADKAQQTPGKLLVDLGGDMFVTSHDKQTVCRVGIRDPFSSNRSRLWGLVKIKHGAVVTSGTYERHFMVDGKRYCHIVNPHTGQPIETNLVSVTIISPSGAMADALATAVFVLGEEKGCALINRLPETEILLIRKDKSSYISNGLINNFEKI